MAPAELRSRGRIDGGALAPLFAIVQAWGHDADGLCRDTGLDPEAFRPSTRRWVPVVLTDRIWDAATDRLRPDLPFRVAETIQPSSYGLLTYLLACCSDVQSALSRLTLHYHLLSTATRYRFEADARGGHLAADMRGERPPAVETFALAVALEFVRRQTTAPVALREVRLAQARPAPKVVAAHAAGFQAKVSYGSATPGWSVATSSLAIPLRGAEPGLLALLEEHAAAVGTAGERERLAVRVRDQVRARGVHCAVRAADVARDLAVTERTLRRLLHAEGTSFQAELDDVLARAAAERLSVEPVADVAAALGFSEEAAFRRAFRRWFGATPRGYAAAAAQGRPLTVRGALRRG
jgi:AraC-like DNA-binding protein